MNKLPGLFESEAETTVPSVTVFTDGACRGNPGPGGWAAIVRENSTQRELSGGSSLTTNNRMELRAVIHALESLPQPSNVHLVSDSQYVLKGIHEWLVGWKRRGWKTASKAPVKNADLWQSLDRMLQTHKITSTWVRGHQGHTENERCDTLACLVADSACSKKLPTDME